jgi:ATP-binding cassette subfamily B protein
MSFQQGDATEIGERGVTLSGGQRQRIALARAFLSNPRILILDDSTSAIDSATEDEIQQAMRRVQRGRTTLLITHRLAQIRWADAILVLDAGGWWRPARTRMLASPHYRRISRATKWICRLWSLAVPCRRLAAIEEWQACTSLLGVLYGHWRLLLAGAVSRMQNQTAHR